MLMNGDYSHLKDLLQEISPSMSQVKLQKLQVLSKFTLPKVYNIVVWKLHESIPYRMQCQRPGLACVKRKAKEVHEDSVQPKEDVQAVEDQDGIKPMERSSAKYLPVKTIKGWSECEMELINLDPGVKDKDSNQKYLESCWKNCITARRFDAFRHKRTALLKKPSDNQ
ncbi:taar1 [Pungitius sinensis]